jgi:hypothetical protein
MHQKCDMSVLGLCNLMISQHRPGRDRAGFDGLLTRFGLLSGCGCRVPGRNVKESSAMAEPLKGLRVLVVQDEYLITS